MEDTSQKILGVTIDNLYPRDKSMLQYDNHKCQQNILLKKYLIWDLTWSLIGDISVVKLFVGS